MEKTVAECTQSRMAYILTPEPARNSESLSKTLLEKGFEKVAKPEFLLFEGGSANIVTLYQKKVKKGGENHFGKMGRFVVLTKFHHS